MNKDERSLDLRAAIPDTPDMCREAVLHAASTYREEKAMWKPHKMILAAALIVMLLCGTAYAIVNYYSVRDYVADGQTSVEFEENIIPLEKTVTTHGLSFMLGDAVFDGTDLAFTMNIAAAEDAVPVFVWPHLQAFCGGEELNVDYLGTDSFSDLGTFIPNYLPEERLMGTGNQGARATLDAVPQGDVTWRYTISLYKPTGEVVQARDWDDRNESYGEWEAYLRGLYKEGKIGFTGVASILDWVSAIDMEHLPGNTFGDVLLRTGLFELVDTVTFEFTAAVPQKTVLVSGESFPFDGYTVHVTSLTQSFMQLDYTLTITFDEPYLGHEHYLDQFYNLSDQNGTVLRRRDALLVLADDRMSCTVTGSVERISDEPITAVTFTRRVYDWPEELMIPAFTVDLTK